MFLTQYWPYTDMIRKIARIHSGRGVAAICYISFSHDSQVASGGIKSRPQVAPTRDNGRCLPPVCIPDVFGSPYLTVGA